MRVTKEQLLSRLQELQIGYSKYEHPVVLTVEAQAKYVGHLGGGLSKNLFLKDKKNRFYIVSALADTKVDLKVLSARLGLGKGGVRMAPEEALGEMLQVPVGCVTPFALVNESARHVYLLLDQGFKTKEHCLFHPLSNDVTISLNSSDLDKFLKSIGKDSSYVDLEANPSVGKDQPPDLSFLVSSLATSSPDTSEDPNSSKGHKENNAPTVSNPTKVTANVSKPSPSPQKVRDKTVKSSNPLGSTASVERYVAEILDKTSALLLSQITEETIKQHGGELGTVLSNAVKTHLASELNSTTMTFKNAAYTEGFHAGIQHRPKPKY